MMFKNRSENPDRFYVFLKFLKAIADRDVPFEALSENEKNRIYGFLEAKDITLSIKQFISVVHFFSVIRLTRGTLKDFNWDKKILAMLDQYLDQFEQIDLTKTLFDLAYLDYTWADLNDAELSDSILLKIKYLKPTLHDAAVLLQSLEYMGACKYQNSLLDAVLDDMLRHIEQNFVLFKTDKHLNNAFFVLHRNLFNIPLNHYFSESKQKAIQTYGEMNSTIALRGIVAEVRDSVHDWLNSHHIVAQKNVIIPKSGFTATVWLPDNEIIIEIVLGKALNERYRAKKKAILELFGYQNFMLIDVNVWLSYRSNKKLGDLYFNTFKTLLPQSSQPEEAMPQFILMRKNAEAVPAESHAKTAVRTEALTIPSVSHSKPMGKQWSEDAAVYEEVWGMPQYFFNLHRESGGGFESMRRHTADQPPGDLLPRRHKY